MKKYLLYGKNLVKKYNKKTVVDNIDFWVKPCEFVTILGPSGCGKTTLLKIFGGFVKPDDGEIYFEGKSILKLPPHKREINTVFQNYALFPHMNVYENISFGLKIKKYSKKIIEKKVMRILKLVNLEEYKDRGINQLSGGQQQRVAIARALVNEPKILLLDEPLGALDLKLRKNMQIELKNMQKELGITFIYVTHDQEEALTMSDKIIILNDGKIQQIGKPTDIYNEPKSAFVANFIGESNIYEGIMPSDYNVSLFGKNLKCLDSNFEKNEVVDVVIRPEDIKIKKCDQGILNGIISSIVFKGVHYEIVITSGKYTFLVHSIYKFSLGDKISIDLTPDDLHIMKKERCEK